MVDRFGLEGAVTALWRWLGQYVRRRPLLAPGLACEITLTVDTATPPYVRVFVVNHAGCSAREMTLLGLHALAAWGAREQVPVVDMLRAVSAGERGRPV